MFNIGSSGLMVTLAAPALVAGLAVLLGRRTPRQIARAGAFTTGLGLLAAVAMAVGSATGQTVGADLLGLQFTADRLAVVLLLLVFGVSAIVQSFAVRYLAGDPRAGWFAGGAGLLTSASAGLATASTLITLAICWTLAGIALCLLLGTYWHLPAARDGVRRTAIAFLIGDLALWAGVAAATASWGRIDLNQPAAGFSGPLLPILGLLVVVAALSRSAQIPFHRWLPATLAAPTPVSALLHAGVVNAGGILLIRLAPLASDDLARTLTVTAGAATMAYGAAVMLVKPDVKGALAHSTTAQMGFMILTCGLGLWAAAVIHLVAHGFYKATLFLSSGSAVAARRRHDTLPPLPPVTGVQKLAHGLAAIGLPGAALGAGLFVTPPASGGHAAEQALLIFAWVTGAAVTWGWLQRRPGQVGALTAAAFLVPAAVAYVAVITAVGGFLAPALPPSTLPVSAVWAITAAAALGLGALALVRRAPRAERLRNALYTSALAAGHVPAWQSSPVQPTGARS
ncbi:proton-conducting transporter membrane subunit [Mycolicibacterium sp.]|uniref:proton-conducting transporter transmembrane domain-containing protein n=1 Tax=Mycolicibacterium sp. TaxID=2320850 RepID=UPI0028A8A2A4|nr:proton-conducting transporter membrane subunit [Mycolicibacterium sp.]